MAIISQPLALSYIHNCNQFSFDSLQSEWVSISRDNVQFYSQQVEPVNDIISVDMIAILLANFASTGDIVNNIVVVEKESLIKITTQEFGDIEFTAMTGPVGTGSVIILLQQPDFFSFAFDCKDLILETSLETIISFQKDGVLFLEEKYFPFAGQISIRLKDIFINMLSCKSSDSETLYKQTEQYAMFSIIFPSQTLNFWVIAGGRNSDTPASDFMLKNLLTNRPQISILDKKCPLIFSFAKLRQEAVVMLHLYKCWENDFDDWLVSLPAIQTDDNQFSIHTVNYTFEQLIDLINANSEYSTSAITHVDVVIRHSTEVQDEYEYSNPFRFIFSRQTLPHDDIFFFENALGSLEAIIFEGIMEETQAHKSISYKINDVTSEYRNDFSRSFKKNTGIFKNEFNRKWASEFFSSKKRYHHVNGISKEIYVNSIEAKSTKFELNDFAFDFSYSEDSRYCEIPRASSLPAL